jgi:hypothetical protein
LIDSVQGLGYMFALYNLCVAWRVISLPVVSVHLMTLILLLLTAISRAQVSAPPGFSIPSRLPPPGFSSHERSEQTFDSLSSG